VTETVITACYNKVTVQVAHSSSSKQSKNV